MQADHSVQMLRKHYWEVVNRETAERYWAIRPLLSKQRLKRPPSGLGLISPLVVSRNRSSLEPRDVKTGSKNAAVKRAN
jgi:hypothetical protein